MTHRTRDTGVESPYHYRAQELVVDVLEATHPGTHISGPLLARAVCMVARLRFGLVALLVLEHWGLRTTHDVGRLVFHMVDEGIVRAAPEDSPDDFYDLFNMAEFLERDYPWGRS